MGVKSPAAMSSCYRGLSGEINRLSAGSRRGQAIMRIVALVRVLTRTVGIIAVVEKCPIVFVADIQLKSGPMLEGLEKLLHLKEW